MPANSPQQDNLAAAIAEVSDRMAALIKDEIALAKAEMAEKTKSLARGAAAVAAGAVFGIFAVVFGLGAIAWGINSAFNGIWEGFVITFGILLVLTVAAFLFAWRKLRGGAPQPKMAIDEAKKIRATLTARSEAKP